MGKQPTERIQHSEDSLLSPEQQQAPDLAMLTEASKALARRLKVTAEEMNKQRSIADTAEDEYFSGAKEYEDSVKKAISEIERSYREGTIDKREVIRLWADCTGNDLPTHLTEQIDQIHKGTLIMWNAPNGKLMGGPAIGDAIVSIGTSSLQASVKIIDKSTIYTEFEDPSTEEEGGMLIPVDENTFIGEKSILEALKQRIPAHLVTSHDLMTLKNTYHSVRNVRKVGITVPEEITEALHSSVGELFKDASIYRIGVDRHRDYDSLVNLLKMDALYNGSTANIDILLPKIKISDALSRSSMRELLEEVGKAIDLAENGVDSVFLAKNSKKLSPVVQLGASLRAGLLAYTRYMELKTKADEKLSSENESVTET